MPKYPPSITFLCKILLVNFGYCFTFYGSLFFLNEVLFCISPEGLMLSFDDNVKVLEIDLILESLLPVKFFSFIFWESS